MTTIAIEMQGAISWLATKCQSGDRWVAECEALGLSMEGNSLDELHSLISEASFALFVDLFEDGELEQFLMDRGWQAGSLPSRCDVDDEIDFSIPWALIAQGTPYGPDQRTH